MTNVQPTIFPTIEEAMDLARSMVNDMFAGANGAHGRILTDTASFTLPYLNSAISYVLRKLRNEGCTFPTINGWVLNNVPPVVQADPSVFIAIGYNGTYNGQTTVANPRLPGDCYQIYQVRQRVTGSNLPFSSVTQAQTSLVSGYQNNWMGQWSMSNFQLRLNGSLVAQDLMIDYVQLQPPINTPAASFSTTPIYIIDSTDAIAAHIAIQYGEARGGNPTVIASKKEYREECISDMANEYIRRSQTQSFRRISYQGGGSNNAENTTLGGTGVVA